MAENDNTPNEPAAEAADDAGTSSQNSGCSGFLYGGKPWSAFTTIALIFSFIVNIIFFIVLLAIAPLILPLVNDVVNPIVSGLNQSFIDMGDATITRVIQVDDEIPISFVLPLDQDTQVVLTESVPLRDIDARFVLPANGGYINGKVSLDLPPGLQLPVHLNLDVPVEQTVPVQLAVDVDIPLSETELGQPFTDLQEIFGPLDELLGGLPTSNEDLLNRLLAISQQPETPEETAPEAGGSE
jgi:hypothetical protein